MKEIKAIIQPFMLEHVLHALGAMKEIPGVTVSEVTGWGKARGGGATEPVHEAGHTLAPKAKLEIVVSDALAPQVAEVIATSAHTGNVGDGKIFVYDVRDAIKIRTGERSQQAL